MQLDLAGENLIKGFEGLFLKAYDDANDRIVLPGERCFGTLTIGWGHTDAAGAPEVFIGQSITTDQAETIFQSDMRPVEADVTRLVKVPLTQGQFNALVSFQYNTGWLEHPHCSLLQALNAGNYTLADQDFMLYDRARGRVLIGLDRRRTAEKAMFARSCALPGTGIP